MANDVVELIDTDATCAALRANTSRLCSLLRRVTNPGVPAIGTWTVGDVANHITWGIENYTMWLEDRDAPDLDDIKNMARWNVDTVGKMPPADLKQVAERMETATDGFIRVARTRPSSVQVRWYAGNWIPLGVAVCMRLVEATVHGLDIARAVTEKWPIDASDARTMSYGLAYIAPYFVDNSKLTFSGSIEVRIRGGARLYYIVHGGNLEVRTSHEAADWHLSVDPVAWILVATQRESQWRAALTGRIVGWGRRPSLPFQLRAASFQG